MITKLQFYLQTTITVVSGSNFCLLKQAGNGTFNKGAIMNAAFHAILERKLLLRPLAYICFVFHDVDMLPEDDRNLYSCSEYPRHLSVAVNEFDYRFVRAFISKGPRPSSPPSDFGVKNGRIELYSIYAQSCCKDCVL